MNTITNNKEIGFWQLISNISKVEIPIIQRDFAQGRENEKTKKIRDLFLKNIIETLESENESLELDFIYGDFKNGIFQPLDGQQRLTTLFLLHWYIALKTSNLPSTKNHFLKFTYETRISSREFCNELVKNGEFLGEGESLIEKITDSSWFFLSWKKDPTIKAMLVMLDSIEKQLNRKNDEELMNFWQKLISENPPITFHFKELNDIGLTDDLYVKMNARGIALTIFENFKARFEKHVETNKWETDISFFDTFSHKIDTVCTDLFWKHRGDDNVIDNELIKFIAGIAINFYAENLEIFTNEKGAKREEIESRITILFNNPNEITPEDFPSKASFEYLKKCFEIYSNKEKKYNELIPENLSLWEYLEDKKVKINGEEEIYNSLFIEFTRSDKAITYKQRVLFYAQTQFLLQTATFCSESFAEWMRVVRNIVHNATIDSATTFIGAIGLINELSNGCKNIYEYLCQNKIQSTFASKQTSEEVLKSSIIEKSKDNKKVIFSTEDTNFFKGKIAFALYCVGFDNKEDSFDTNLLNSIRDVVVTHFSTKVLSNEFRRAFLTIKNNDYYEYWKSFSFGTSSKKRCLIEDIMDLKYSFTHGSYRDYLKDLLLKMVNQSLNEIIKAFSRPKEMPEWKWRLITEPDLLDNYCQAHYLGIPQGDSCCFLFKNKKRPSSIDECQKIE